VAADHRKGDRHVAGDQVLVGVTQARRGQLDEDLTFLGRVELDRFDAPLAVALPQDGGFGFHLPSPG